MFIEPEVEGDPFEVSDIDTMLNYINADTVAPKSAMKICGVLLLLLTALSEREVIPVPNSITST
jgi:hypothetical protein